MDNPAFQWDIVTYPVFRAFPMLKPKAPDSSFLAISLLSKQKEEPFQVISYLISDEHQLEISKHGSRSPLKRGHPPGIR
ncbi:hypothetical protein ACFPYJ_31760 [Paenibacillus solisilvae]|uniref:Uncharacterized protein n=1 Tax=Paenibacillus solisilvae TaxID=2486751 RepID=A0ABW0W7D5_9BACL